MSRNKTYTFEVSGLAALGENAERLAVADAVAKAVRNEIGDGAELGDFYTEETVENITLTPTVFGDGFENYAALVTVEVIYHGADDFDVDLDDFLFDEETIEARYEYYLRVKDGIPY
jgi:hypothetical protein